MECSKKTISDSTLKKNIIRITILYSNSSNNYLEDCKCPSYPHGGIVRRATLVKNIRKDNDNVLVFDAGDMLSAYEDKLKSEYTLKCYEYLKYDAICIGDQELANGIDFFIERIKNLPVIVANFAALKDDVFREIGKPYRVFEKQNLKIGVIGVISENAFRYYPKEITRNITVGDSAKAIKQSLTQLKKECDIIVLLSHSGLDEDKQLARQINGIDVIIGGHTQNLIEKKLIENNTLIVQAGKNGEYLGELNVLYNKKTKQIEDIDNKLHLLDKKVSDDPYIRGLINEYNEKRGSKEVSASNDYEKKIDIVLFYSPGCESCEEVKEEILPFLEEKYKINFKRKYYNIEETENFEKLLEYEEKLKASSGTTPTLIINNKMLSGIDAIKLNLEKEVKKVLGQ